MKKIAIIHPSSELYGADRIMVSAAKSMQNYKVCIYLPKKGPLVDFIKDEIPSAEIKITPDIPIIQRSMFNIKGCINVLRAIYRFKKYINQEHNSFHFEFIYVNTLATVLTLFSLRKFKLPVLMHVHEIIQDPKIIAKVTSHIAVRYASKVICVSQAVKDNLLDHTKLKSDHVLVLRNGIKPIEEKKNLPNFKIQFYLFGRIKRDKGQWYVLEALKLIDKEVLKYAKFNFVGGTLAGSEYLLDELKSIIKIHGVEDQINLIDFTSDISPLLSKADVCLIPSLMKDPFPTTVLEAMSLGKTIITTDGGGAKEAIVNGDSGIIIPADNPELFAAKIKEVIMDRKTAKELGRNAKIRFYECFTEVHFSEKWNKMLLSFSSQFGKVTPKLVLRK